MGYHGFSRPSQLPGKSKFTSINMQCIIGEAWYNVDRCKLVIKPKWFIILYYTPLITLVRYPPEAVEGRYSRKTDD
jgi:hypothetical protein